MAARGFPSIPVLLIGAVCAICACGRRTDAPTLPPVGERMALSVGGREVDLLVVVDNSSSPVEVEQFAPGFVTFVQSLRSPLLGGAGCSASHPERCEIPDIRIGVVTTDIGAGGFHLPGCDPGGDGGRLWMGAIPGCTVPTGRWISVEGGAVHRQGAAADPVKALVSALNCFGWPPFNGCGFEQPLEAARRALDPALGINPGFLRPDSVLVVSLITDEDDCSAARPEIFDPGQPRFGLLTSYRCWQFGIECDESMMEPGLKHNCRPRDGWLFDVEGYARFFQTLKPGRVVALVVAGPPTPVDIERDEGGVLHPKASCQTSIGRSVPAPRLAAFARELAGHGLFNPLEVDSCATLQPVGRPLASTVLDVMGATCLPRPPLTVDGTLACAADETIAADTICEEGCLEAVDCTVEEVSRGSDGRAVRRAIPRCPGPLFDPHIAACGTTCPCWRVVSRSTCPGGATQTLQVLWSQGPIASQAVHAEASCASTALPWGSPGLAGVRQCGR